MIQRRQLGFAAASAIGLSGCSFSADEDHIGPDAPRFEPAGAFAPGRRFRRALVLSSGGPRGFVHVGVIKALQQIGFKPDLIVGSSAGALVGVLWAAGWPASEMERLALDLGPTDLVRVNAAHVLNVGGRGGERVSGSAMAHKVNEWVGGKRLEDLPIPFAATVIDQATRMPLALNFGDTGVAVQASSAIEGQMSPVRIRGKPYVDADQVEPLPSRRAKALGAQKVLAVDASAHEWDAPPGAERWRAGDLRKRALTQPDAAASEVVLHPMFGYYVSLSREFRLRAIAAGERDTLAAAQRILAL